MYSTLCKTVTGGRGVHSGTNSLCIWIKGTAHHFFSTIFIQKLCNDSKKKNYDQIENCFNIKIKIIIKIKLGKSRRSKSLLLFKSIHIHM